MPRRGRGAKYTGDAFTTVELINPDEWREFEKLIMPAAFERRLNARIRQATYENAQIIRRQIRKNIMDGSFSSNRPRNAPLTQYIKRKDKPLIGTRGWLVSSIGVEMNSAFEAEIGIRKGLKRAPVAVIIHEGGKLHPGSSPTRKQRSMFHALWLVGSGKADPSILKGRALELWRARPDNGWKLLSSKTLKIPARPFIREVIEDIRIHQLLAHNWTEAASAAIAGRAPLFKKESGL